MHLIQDRWKKNVASSADTVDESDAQDDSFDPLFRLKSAKEIGFNETK
jgi:hypothetical protein